MSIKQQLQQRILQKGEGYNLLLPVLSLSKYGGSENKDNHPFVPLGRA